MNDDYQATAEELLDLLREECLQSTPAYAALLHSIQHEGTSDA